MLAVATGDGEPLGAVESTACSAAAPTSTTTHAARRPAPRVVVLQAAAQHVGSVVVRRHHVELPDRKVVQEPPALGAVLRDVHPAVVPLDHAVGVLGIDPQRMMVYVHAAVDRR